MLEGMQQGRTQEFQDTVLAFYHEHGRHDLPWRTPEADGSFDPYKIMVSEIMLQQTQVARVIPKFQAFLRLFPDFKSLAAAPLGDVLKAWSGLGYNRRAKFLWQAAGQVQQEFGGQVPHSSHELVKLSGIGPNTAGAVLAYSCNIPSVFIETNVRTVFIHHFFAGRQGISDRDILEVVARSLPEDARTWYWALMDYGTHLKQTIGNLNKSSKHYTVQSRFVGSKRQIRGQVLRELGQGMRAATYLAAVIPDERLPQVLAGLVQEGLVEMVDNCYKLPGAVLQ
jgi:A/G-specific adenine glycosylase